MIAIPKKTIRNLAILGVSLLLIAGVMIYPNLKGLEKLEKEAGELRRQVEEQKNLRPVFDELVKRSRNPLAHALPFPERQPLTTDEIRTALIDMKQRAEALNLVVDDIVPGVRGFVENAPRIQVTMSMTGQIEDFKAYLLQLSAEPFVDMLQSIQVQSKKGYALYYLVLWVARKT